jgi:hypothetical protein
LSVESFLQLLIFSRVTKHMTAFSVFPVVPLSLGPFNQGENMSSTHNPGRVAGFYYRLLCTVGPLRLAYIPAKLFVHGNAAATINNIAAHEVLFRLGIVGDLFGAVILIKFLYYCWRTAVPITTRELIHLCGKPTAHS